MKVQNTNMSLNQMVTKPFVVNFVETAIATRKIWKNIEIITAKSDQLSAPYVRSN